MDVEGVNLVVTLPSTQIKMVVLQPYVDLTNTNFFQWTGEKKQEQVQAIKKTLEIANDGGDITHFTLFPEFSIPGIEGLETISDAMNAQEWPSGTIIVGALDGLTKEEYATLCNEHSTFHESNAPDEVQDNQWVNCCVMWVKNDNGQLSKYIQPKISPSWPENTQTTYDMFKGNAVYLYNGNYDRDNQSWKFVTFMCYDWIDHHEELTIQDQVLHSINNMEGNTPKILDWVFVLQHNPKPNSPEFLNSTHTFLNVSQYNHVIRTDTAVININNATDSKPCKYKEDQYGFTSVTFHPRSKVICCKSRPTVCMTPQRLRNSRILHRCKDVVFREMGACVHSFRIRISRFLPDDATGRSLPVEEAKVYRLDHWLNDPRLPDEAVPACIKWVNDELDDIPILGETEPYTGASLASRAITSQEQVTQQLRWLENLKLENNIHCATCNQTEDKRRNPDEWNKAEKDALEHMLYTLTITGVVDSDINIKDSSLHGRIKINDEIVELVAIKGSDHTECKKYFDSTVTQHINHTTLIISRDPDNNPFFKCYGKKITEPLGNGPGSTEKGGKFTVAGSSVFQTGYRHLLDEFQGSENPRELAQRITSYVN